MKKNLFLLFVGLLLCSCSIQPPLTNDNSNRIVENSNNNFSEQTGASENISQKINLCLASLNDPTTPGREERQLNMLRCFKELSQQGFSADICKSLKSDNLIGCLGGFAKGQNDLSICDLATGVARGDCLEVQQLDF